MKKKNVVKREVREKKTHERTPLRIQKPKENKPVVVTEFVVREEVKKQHTRKGKKIIVETTPVEPQIIENNISDISIDIENNEQNI